MPLRSEMSVSALYAYDPDLFHYLHVPLLDPDTETPFISKDVIIQNILIETMDLEVLYPDPVFLKNAIKWWSYSNQNAWQCIAEALYKGYNPIENYDRIEEWDDTNTRTEKWTDGNTRSTSDTDTSSQTVNGSGHNTRTDDTKSVVNGTTGHNGTVTGNNGSTTTQSGMAYNDNIWKGQNKEEVTANTSNTTNETGSNNSTQTDTGTVKNDGTHNETTTGNVTRTGSVTDSGSRDGTIGDTGKRSGRVHGNIGVTTSQQMVEAEIKLRADYQLTRIIVDQFKQRFCLLIY